MSKIYHCNIYIGLKGNKSCVTKAKEYLKECLPAPQGALDSLSICISFNSLISMKSCLA